jgi:uncharacterized protein YkwD
MTISKMILCASVLLLSEVPVSAENPQTEQTVEQTTEKSADNRDASAKEKAQQPASDKTAADKDEAVADKDKAVADNDKTAANSEPAERVVDGVKLAAIEANIVSYTNEERARFGLEPFKVDKDLMETAREHAAWMTRTRNMIHTARAVAENIAMGQPHSSDVVRAWMNSPGHRANILNSGHQRIGVAAYTTEDGTIFWCQQFQQ